MADLPSNAVAPQGPSAAAAKTEEAQSYSIRLLNIVLAVCLLGIVIYPFHNSSLESAVACFGVMLVVALASLLAGALPGFLFGIPIRQGFSSASPYIPNTNLEQVSDWLTKLLVGAGLTQIAEIPSLVDGVGQKIATTSEGAVCPVVASSLTVFFVCLGFMYGYLWTSLKYIDEISSKSAMNSILKSEKKTSEQKTITAMAEVSTKLADNKLNMETNLDAIVKEKTKEGSN